MYEEYRFFDKDVVYYPAKDFIFYNADIHGNLIVKERIDAIKHIAENKKAGEDARLTVVTTIDGCLDKLLPLEYIENNIMTLAVGDEVNLSVYEKKLVNSATSGVRRRRARDSSRSEAEL